MKKKVVKRYLKDAEDLHEMVERKQDKQKSMPTPSKKEAVEEYMEGEEIFHKYLEDKLHGPSGKMPLNQKSKAKKMAKKRGKK